jgi:hypothetical protein
MITAGYLSVNGGHHSSAAPRGRADPAALRLVRRHRRPAARAFRALHAMQALPLLGLWLVAALGYSAVTLAVFAQAIMGLPLIPLG